MFSQKLFATVTGILSVIVILAMGLKHSPGNMTYQVFVAAIIVVALFVMSFGFQRVLNNVIKSKHFVKERFGE